MSKKVEWKAVPELKDYEGAEHFLMLLCSKADAKAFVDCLTKADPIEWAGKDLLRAASLPLLSKDDPHVAADLKKISKGKPLPPVLLVRGDLKKGQSLVIADGYHRICASDIVDEGSFVPCRLADR
ncbi:MAG: hypothetical protein NVS3B5_21770 [Sphingomicrobium sp.]